ncbi:MAG: C40 family peptidase [Verrucomicrobiae bacterium]|nr:C40 family peptidase [Verrucomicrobiae bacterium]
MSVGILLGFLGCLSTVLSDTPAEVGVASLRAGDLVEFPNQPRRIRDLIESALALTERKLGYQFGSHSPSQGGMDCSGTVYRVLQDLEIGAPRSSRAMFAWVEEAGNLHRCGPEVQSMDDRRFDSLEPGDLLFWSGTYDTGKGDDAISHVMIYLGTSRKDGKPVIFGASSGRRYRGLRIHGVSVFDFQIPAKGSRSVFVGYGAPPGLR